jgi:hypothetical protein
MAKMRSAAGAFGKSPPGGAKAGAAGEQKAAAHASNFASKFKKPNKGALAAAAAAPAPATAPTETAIAIAAAPPPAPPTPAAATSGSDDAAAAAAKTPGSS